jgi:hypothetical protein
MVEEMNMKKYVGNSIMILGSLVLVFGMFYVFSAHSLAGNQNNAASTGNVTGIVICEANDDPIHVDRARIAINSDECMCDLEDPSEAPLACDDDESCPVCLASLQRAGMTITQANGYTSNDTEEIDNLYHYLLTGNAGPFLTRLGGCPCAAP